MSDAAFRSRGQSPVAADVPDVAQHYVPNASSLFRGDRMEGVNAEREAASSQIQRSLKAWRKAKEEDAPQSYIPQASGGKPLPTDVRKKMEPRLGADLADVRMHDGGEAAQASNKLGARAFTVGADVHFNSGEFNPGTREGDKLIAHELTHVVQGQKGGIQRKEKEDGGDTKEGAEVSDPAEAAEVEADEKSEDVAGDIHDEKKDKDDKKKDDKKDKEGSGLDAANEDDEKKKKGEEGGEAEGEEKKDEVKEAAPATAAKLFRKIWLAKKVPKPTERTEDQAKELEQRIVAHGATAKRQLDTIKNAVSVGVPVIGALVGFLAGGHEGMMAGFSLGSVTSALANWLGFAKKKEKIIEETDQAVGNVQAIKLRPQLLDGLVTDMREGKTDAAEAGDQLEKLKEALPRIEKRAAERKAKKAKGKADKKGPDTTQKVEEKAEKGANVAEGGEVAVEVLEKVLELGHAAAAVAPVLKGASVALDLVALAAEVKEEKEAIHQLDEIEKANKAKGH